MARGQSEDKGRVGGESGKGVSLADRARRAYYRYTLMTGVYMLGSTETWILHSAMMLGFILLVLYTSAFFKQLIGGYPHMG